MTRSAQELRAAQLDLLYPCLSTYYDEPLVLADGNGSHVWDSDGNKYLDLFAGILTTSVGHCNPEVDGAVRQQLGRLGHTSTLYVSEPQIAAARALAEITPGDLRRTYFTNSGTEAIETAIMLAYMHTGRSEIIALRHAYSGRSILATNVSAQAPWRPLPTSLPGIKHVAAPYPYRAPIPYESDEQLVDFYMRDLEEAIETTTNGRPAAFIAETILGVGGSIVPPCGYFQRAAELIRSYGGLFICDEVQAGFGRTGDHWFGIEHWDVVPDIMVMAKGIANGFPVGATTTTAAIAESWRGKTISTYGGSPASMAAMVATQEILRRERAPERAAGRGARLRAGLDALSEEHEWMGEVRGMGLMIGIEIVVDRETKESDSARAGRFLEATKSEGVLVGLGGLRGNVVRIGPSLLIFESEIDDGLARLRRACATASADSAS